MSSNNSAPSSGTRAGKIEGTLIAHPRWYCVLIPRLRGQLQEFHRVLLPWRETHQIAHREFRFSGTMNAAEFVVAVCTSAGFIVGLGFSAIRWDILLPLLIGGVIAAPFAAWIAHRLPMRIMGVTVGGMIIFTNSFTLTRAFEVNAAVQATLLIVEAVVWAGLVAYVTAAHLRGRGASVEPTLEKSAVN